MTKEMEIRRKVIAHVCPELASKEINNQIVILQGQMRKACVLYRQARIYKTEGARERTCEYINSILEDGMYNTKAGKREPIINRDNLI